MKLVEKQGVFDNFLKIAITLERMRIFENGFHHWNQRENSIPTIYIKILCENIYIILKMHLHLYCRYMFSKLSETTNWTEILKKRDNVVIIARIDILLSDILVGDLFNTSINKKMGKNLFSFNYWSLCSFLKVAFAGSIRRFKAVNVPFTKYCFSLQIIHCSCEMLSIVVYQRQLA